MQGDGKGFPDLALVPPPGDVAQYWAFPDGTTITVSRPRRVEYWELKTGLGQLSPDQIIWRDRLLGAGAVWRLVRPDDWTSGRVDAWLS